MNITAVASTIFQPFGATGGSTAPLPGRGGAFRVALAAKLNAIPGLAAIVGPAIFVGALPQQHDVWRDGPALVYTVESCPRGHVLTGPDGTATATVQFYAAAAQESVADAIALALFDALHGLVNDGTWGDGSVPIMSSFQDDESDMPEPPPPGTDRWLYAIPGTYVIRYRLADIPRPAPGATRRPGAAPASTPVDAFRVALRAKLDGSIALNLLVGSSIFPGALPQPHDVWRDGPAITYTVATYPRGSVLAGSDGTGTADVQLSAWAGTEAQADRIARTAFDLIDGTVNDPTWGDGSVEIMSVVHEDEADVPEPPPPGTDRWLYQIPMLFSIKHRVTIPTLGRT